MHAGLFTLDRLLVLRTTSKPKRKALKNNSSLLIFTRTHYKRIGHVKIPKPHCLSREWIDSNCRRFDWLVFVVFDQSVRLSRLLPQLYLHSDESPAIQPWPSLSVYAKVGFCGSLLMFFAYKKLLGGTETRTRDRMYLGRIRSVRDIYRDDRARIATCSLRTPTDRQTYGEL